MLHLNLVLECKESVDDCLLLLEAGKGRMKLVQPKHELTVNMKQQRFSFISTVCVVCRRQSSQSGKDLRLAFESVHKRFNKPYGVKQQT